MEGLDREGVGTIVAVASAIQVIHHTDRTAVSLLAVVYLSLKDGYISYEEKIYIFTDIHLVIH